MVPPLQQSTLNVGLISELCGRRLCKPMRVIVGGWRLCKSSIFKKDPSCPAGGAESWVGCATVYQPQVAVAWLPQGRMVLGRTFLLNPFVRYRSSLVRAHRGSGAPLF